MRVLISGASGLIGSALGQRLAAEGHQVIPLSRTAAPAGQPGVQWDPTAGRLPPEDLEGLDAVVHLAGESVAGGRWTPERKERIRRSRVEGTGLLSRSLAALGHPPEVLVCASAIGYYGDRGDEELTEESPPGEGFLAEVTVQWEAAADPARQAGIRVVHLRLGTVLSPAGGALAKMLTPFRMGLGGRLGRGGQYWSWVSLSDAVAAALHCLARSAMSGPVNGVAPEAVTNAEFTAALGRALRRPTRFPVPGALLKLLLGEMGEALLLSSARVRPGVLLNDGFGFGQPQLTTALGAMLSRGTR